MQSAFRDNLLLIRQLADSRSASFKQHLKFLPVEVIAAIAEGLVNLQCNPDLEITPALRRFIRKVNGPFAACLKSAKASKLEVCRRLLQKQGLAFFRRCMLPLLEYFDRHGNSISVSSISMVAKSSRA